MRKTLLAFVHARNMARGNPPQHEICSIDCFEPRVPLLNKMQVEGAVHEPPQGLNIFPHRHVEQNAVISVWTKISSVASRSLKSPYEAGRTVGQRVDFI